MTVYNQDALLRAAPIEDMAPMKMRSHGVSYGLGEAGYDICIKQGIYFQPDAAEPWKCTIGISDGNKGSSKLGRFVIASAIERFNMPHNLVGVVHDKSTWARRGLSVFNTVIEPGWQGFLTLELVYHGTEHLHIPAGAGIAQVLFSELALKSAYSGKYQNQDDRPVAAIAS